MKIDGVLRHVKDLRPVIQTQISSSDESDSEDSERLIYLNSDPLDSDSDASSLPTDEVSIETQTANESMREDEACMIPQRSTRQRRKLPPALFVIMRSGESVGKIMTYLTSVWLHFVRFNCLTKKNLKWQHTVAFVFAYLSWSNTDSQLSYANETVRCYKKSHGGNGNNLKQGVLHRQTHATGLSESVTLLKSTFKQQFGIVKLVQILIIGILIYVVLLYMGLF